MRAWTANTATSGTLQKNYLFHIVFVCKSAVCKRQYVGMKGTEREDEPEKVCLLLPTAVCSPWLPLVSLCEAINADSYGSHAEHILCVCVRPQETGFWFIFHHVPTGPSEGMYSPGKTEHTPMGKFINNRAHSNYRVRVCMHACIHTQSISQGCYWKRFTINVWRRMLANSSSFLHLIYTPEPSVEEKHSRVYFAGFSMHDMQNSFNTTCRQKLGVDGNRNLI